MSTADIKKAAEQKMLKSMENLKNEFAKVRTGRAHVGLLDHIQVDYYGASTPLSGIANITLIDSRTLGIQPWEKKMVQVVEKAIRESDLGVNPATASDVIRVPMPALTEERRKELVKVVHKEAEGTRVAIRNIRRDAIAHVKDLLKAKSVSEDDDRRAQEEIQKLTDRYIGEVDRALHTKEADLMAV